MGQADVKAFYVILSKAKDLMRFFDLKISE